MNAPNLSRAGGAAALAAALLTLACAGRARAEAMEVTYESRGAGITSTFIYKNQEFAGFIGQFNMEVVGGSAFEGFCVNLDQPMHVGATFTVQPRSTDDGLKEGAQIAYLYNTYGKGTLTDKEAAAGLQLAMWELLTDGPGGSLDTGNFRFNAASDPTAFNDALFYLSQAASHTGTATWLDATPGIQLGQPGQSVISPFPPPQQPQQTPVSAPEPTSALLLGVGLVGLAVYRHRRRRT